jgi:hypothetical protein
MDTCSLTSLVRYLRDDDSLENRTKSISTLARNFRIPSHLKRAIPVITIPRKSISVDLSDPSDVALFYNQIVDMGDDKVRSDVKF